LAKLIENRAQHREVFEEAVEGYHKEVVRQLEERLADAKDKRPISLRFNLPMPQDHTRDYDRAIGMLEMSLDDELVLTDQEFASYVQDNWGWMREFVGTSLSYTQSPKAMGYGQFRAPDVTPPTLGKDH